MPLVDFNQKETWDSLYFSEVNGVLCHFERVAKREYFGDDHWAMLRAINPDKTQEIIIIGAAFGWVAEDWIAAGYSVRAIDTSTWIQTNKPDNAVIDILNADCLTTEGRNLIGSGDIIISEDILPCLSDQECLDMSAAMHQLAPQVYHWVSVGPGAMALNWKTLEDWKTLLPNDHFIRRGTEEMI